MSFRRAHRRPNLVQPGKQRGRGVFVGLLSRGQLAVFGGHAVLYRRPFFLERRRGAALFVPARPLRRQVHRGRKLGGRLPVVGQELFEHGRGHVLTRGELAGELEEVRVTVLAPRFQFRQHFGKHEVPFTLGG